MEQIKHVISTMPTDTEIERRNRTLVAFTLLTGARDSAIASMKLKHVDLIAGCVNQDAREVKTKFSKTFNTFFFPVGEEVRGIVAEWVSYLRDEKLWGNDDPLFPSTHVAMGPSRQFEVAGLKRAHWSTATPIRKIFRDASPPLAYRTSTRTALEIPLFISAKKSAKPRNISRRGARTSDMKRF
jgi:integrase